MTSRDRQQHAQKAESRFGALILEFVEFQCDFLPSRDAKAMKDDLPRQTVLALSFSTVIVIVTRKFSVFIYFLFYCMKITGLEPELLVTAPSGSLWYYRSSIDDYVFNIQAMNYTHSSTILHVASDMYRWNHLKRIDPLTSQVRSQALKLDVSYWSLTICLIPG